MPLLTVKLIEGVFDDSQKREMIEKLTEHDGRDRG